MTTIAVVMPNRNDSKFLNKSIDSVLNQSVLPDEFIFIDDNSSDNSILIARNKLKNFKKKKIIQNKSNIGAINSCNKGIKYVKSDYLITLSSNDEMDKDLILSFKSTVSKFKKRPGIWSALCWKTINDKKIKFLSPLISHKLVFLNKKEFMKYCFILGNYFTTPTKIFNKNELLKIGGFDYRIGGLADWSAGIQLGARCGAIFYPKYLGSLTIHENNFLSRTLLNNSYKHLANLMMANGIKFAPKLFKSKFNDKLVKRIQFSHVRCLLENNIYKNVFFKIIYKLSVLLLTKKITGLLIFFVYRPFDIVYYFYYCLIKRIVK